MRYQCDIFGKLGSDDVIHYDVQDTPMNCLSQAYFKIKRLMVMKCKSITIKFEKV